jgi:hypothetical protein
MSMSDAIKMAHKQMRQSFDAGWEGGVLAGREGTLREVVARIEEIVSQDYTDRWADVRAIRQLQSELTDALTVLASNDSTPEAGPPNA